MRDVICRYSVEKLILDMQIRVVSYLEVYFSTERRTFFFFYNCKIDIHVYQLLERSINVLQLEIELIGSHCSFISYER